MISQKYLLPAFLNPLSENCADLDYWESEIETLCYFGEIRTQRWGPVDCFHLSSPADRFLWYISTMYTSERKYFARPLRYFRKENRGAMY